MTTKSDMLCLIEQRGALKDSELARLLGVAHQQVNQAARGLAAAEEITRVPGPDGVIRNRLAAGTTAPAQHVHEQSQRNGFPRRPRGWPVLGRVPDGTDVAPEDLTRLGFVEHKLEAVAAADVPEGGLIGWDTLGTVSDAPGLYCFVGHPNLAGARRVFYVGMTSHLWMVTRGQLPGGVARGGQRYGRPKYAGSTRQRVNAEVARLVADDWTFAHWLKAIEAPPDRATLNARLRDEESRLIESWNLRNVGWNRR